ncbi:MAG TPA: DUF86 domain-containing protein [Syntrophales bacterium]|nr:DUF86 domain-containing protein [Syntrophales bacterium]
MLDILIAARHVLAFSRDLTWERFQHSHLHQHAIAKALENIGEAAKKVSDDTKNAHPAIPWAQIVGMRHRIAHDYFRLDLLKVWEIVTADIPDLIAAIEPLVPPEDS